MNHARNTGFQCGIIKAALSDDLVERVGRMRKEQVIGMPSKRKFWRWAGLAEAREARHRAAQHRAEQAAQAALRARRNRKLAVGATAAGAVIGAGLLAHHIATRRDERTRKTAGLYAGTIPDRAARRKLIAAAAGGAAAGSGLTALLMRRRRKKKMPAKA